MSALVCNVLASKANLSSFYKMTHIKLRVDKFEYNFFFALFSFSQVVQNYFL